MFHTLPHKAKRLGDIIDRMQRAEGMHKFDFGVAISKLRAGERVARAGWNGKGMWLSLVNGWMDPEVYDGIERLPFIQMKTADGKLVPWLASQTDMLADDWTLVQ
jgi:hypothetical protein